MPMEPMVCIANIGTAQRAFRLRGGILALVAGVAVAILGSRLGLGFVGQGVAAALFYIGFTGVFQAREKT